MIVVFRMLVADAKFANESRIIAAYPFNSRENKNRLSRISSIVLITKLIV